MAGEDELSYLTDLALPLGEQTSGALDVLHVASKVGRMLRVLLPSLSG